MPMIYQTRDGDVLDAICAARYGNAGLSDAVTRVLEANQGLADWGAIYPAGVIITLPDLPPAAVELTTSLWD